MFDRFLNTSLLDIGYFIWLAYRRVIREGKEWRFPFSYYKTEKSALILEKKCPD